MVMALSMSKSPRAYLIFTKYILCIVLFLFLSEASFCLAARQNWWMILPDSGSFTLEFVEQQLKVQGVKVRFRSTWLNAISFEADGRQLERVEELVPHAKFQPVLSLITESVPARYPYKYDFALQQMQGDAFVSAGLSGLGVKVGVTDAGFLQMNNPQDFPGLQHLFQNGQIAATRDFVHVSDSVSFVESYYTGRSSAKRKPWSPWGKVFRYLRLANHFHGSAVMQAIAGFDTSSFFLSGLAPDATFYLARTDEGNKEFKEEEDYYVAALEWLHQQGVRLVNTSLGYGFGRMVKADNYKPYQMNGQSMISRAVEIACTTKGMLVIVAAGNEGDVSRWKVVTSPGDASSALTVGAVGDRFEKKDYSGIGPEGNLYMKPDVAAYSLSGTSFSAPAVTGFAACLLEYDPELTPARLKAIITLSSHLYPYGNNYIGYGVPLASRALALLQDSTVDFRNTGELRVSGDVFEFSDPGALYPYVVLFHKRNAWVVVKQQVLKKTGGSSSFAIERPEGTVRTTIQAGFEVIEVFWSDQVRK